MIFWVKWAWGHWYCYRSSNTGYFEAKQIISFFATAFNETGFFRAHFLVKQDYTWETEKLLLIETDFQESSCQLTGQARAAIPFNTCCHWMGFSSLALPLLFPLDLSGFLGACYSTQEVGTFLWFSQWIQSSCSSIKLFEKLLHLMLQRLKQLWLFEASWIPTRRTGAALRSWASSVCFKRASPHRRGTWCWLLSGTGFWASWTSGLKLGVATPTFLYMPHV